MGVLTPTNPLWIRQCHTRHIIGHKIALKQAGHKYGKKQKKTQNQMLNLNQQALRNLSYKIQHRTVQMIFAHPPDKYHRSDVVYWRECRKLLKCTTCTSVCCWSIRERCYSDWRDVVTWHFSSAFKQQTELTMSDVTTESSPEQLPVADDVPWTLKWLLLF